MSRVGSSMRANSGIHFDTGSSSDSLPSSRSLRIARTVKLFVIEAMRNSVPAVDGRVRGAIPDACRFDMREPAVDDDAPHHAWNLPLGGITAEDLVDLRKRGFELPDSLGIGEARWRVSVAREEHCSGKEAEHGDESHAS